MAVAPSFRQGFPMASAPICDPGSGRITDAWLQFLMGQFMRTGGASGPPLDLSGVANAAAAAGQAAAAAASAAADGAALALLGDVHQPPPDLGPLQAGQADLQALYALHDTPDAPPPFDPSGLMSSIADLQALASLNDAGGPPPDAAATLGAAMDQAVLLALALSETAEEFGRVG